MSGKENTNGEKGENENTWDCQVGLYTDIDIDIVLGSFILLIAKSLDWLAFSSVE